MAFEELESPVAAIRPEDQPDIMAYSMLRNFIADLNPRETTPGMELWSEFRYRATGESNYARWTEAMVIDGQIHTVVLYGVHGELPDGRNYDHSSLRCSCSLPDHKSYKDLEEEYQECPAKNLVIQERVDVYKPLVGGNELGAFDDESLLKVTVFLIDLVRRNPRAWPPSDRSDRLLIDPMAEVFEIPKERMRAAAEELVRNKTVHIHGETHPSISIAA